MAERNSKRARLKPGPKPSGEPPMVPVSVMFTESEIAIINKKRGQKTKSEFLGNIICEHLGIARRQDS